MYDLTSICYFALDQQRDRSTMAGFHAAVFVLLLAGILLPSSLLVLVDAFLVVGSSRNSFIKHEQFQLMQTTSNNNVSIEKYQHKTFNLTYLYKKASPGRENDRPLILIHPIGIGLSSWFWDKVLSYYDDNPPIYAPDLIGCGINHGADAWYPNKVGLFFPLSYVEGVETLMNTVIIPRWKGGKGQSQNFDSSNDNNGGCLVVAQGGLAPVGIMLTRRNPAHIQTLMLTSPPTYQDITTSIPQSELERNYNFLSSPILGKLAFTILESRQIIKFFSDLFLFKEECDEVWLNEAMDEVCIESRTPVQVFNAGLLQHKSYENELKEIAATDAQSIVIVSGDGDKRIVDRQAYESELNNCKLVTIDGLNILPWENPVGVIDLINELGY